MKTIYSTLPEEGKNTLSGRSHHTTSTKHSSTSTPERLPDVQLKHRSEGVQEDDTDLNDTTQVPGQNPEHKKHTCLAHKEPGVPD
ncbi:hypothetical protein Taro_015681 [Colocasia esculenta]|uniref:Uncharacterized protein n=1 Tax=Colocasia esculenta TaxID=4460 RepID=A0A843UN16_COLES|nr:hypothetical protein [Colocasia esculenta]